VTASDFWQAAELGEREVGVRESVEYYADAEQDSGWDPHPLIFIECDGAPWDGDGGDHYPHGDPEREKNFVG
jgi:hypothetical protein